MVLHPFTHWLLTTAMRAVYRRERLKGFVYLHRAGLLISGKAMRSFISLRVLPLTVKM